MRSVNVVCDRCSDFGRMGESNVTELIISVEDIKREYPDGEAQVIYKRADGKTYEVEHSREDSQVRVVLTEKETLCEGMAYIEVRWIEGDALKKSVTYKGMIHAALSTDGEAPANPDPESVVEFQTLIAKASAQASRAERAAEDAEEASMRMPYIGESGTWLVWDSANQRYMDTGVKARGEDGKDGNDADLTAEGIVKALGYTPAKADESPTIFMDDIKTGKKYRLYVNDSKLMMEEVIS